MTDTEGTPFEIFADNLHRLPADRAAASIATLEELSLGRILWDKTRDVTRRGRDAVRRSDWLTSAGRRTADASRRVWKQTMDRTATLRVKLQDSRSLTTGQRFFARQYERTAPMRTAIHDRGSAAWNIERVEELIALRTEDLLGEPPDELRAQLVRSISDAVKIGVPPDSTAPGDDWFRSLLRELAKTFGVESDGLSDDQLVDQSLEAIFEDAIQRVRDASRKMDPADRRRAAEKVVELIDAQDLTEAQRRDVSEAFGVDDVTTDAVERALRQGRILAGGYAALVAAGFGTYLAATTIMHAVVTTLLGITLPFGAYTGLTTGMGFLLNPVVAIALAVGLFVVGGRRQSRKLKRRLVGMVILQISAASAAPELVAE